MGKIDLCQLQKEIRQMRRHQKLYKLLKAELGKLGYWRLKPRGDASKGYAVMKNRQVAR